MEISRLKRWDVSFMQASLCRPGVGDNTQSSLGAPRCTFSIKEVVFKKSRSQHNVLIALLSKPPAAISQYCLFCACDSYVKKAPDGSPWLHCGPHKHFFGGHLALLAQWTSQWGRRVRFWLWF